MKDLINTSNELIFKTIIYCLTLRICYGNIEGKSQDVNEVGFAQEKYLVKSVAKQMRLKCLHKTFAICV